jgi:hypothetical protein
MSFVKRTENDGIRKRDIRPCLETELQPERIVGIKDTYLWAWVPPDTFESIKNYGGEKMIATDAKVFTGYVLRRACLTVLSVTHILRTVPTELLRCIWFESVPVYSLSW